MEVETPELPEQSEVSSQKFDVDYLTISTLGFVSKTRGFESAVHRED